MLAPITSLDQMTKAELISAARSLLGVTERLLGMAPVVRLCLANDRANKLFDEYQSLSDEKWRLSREWLSLEQLQDAPEELIRDYHLAAERSTAAYEKYERARERCNRLKGIETEKVGE